MSQPDRRYQLSIRALDVPDRLKGAPVSVEIIPEGGNALRTTLTLSDVASLQTVDGPGNYVVRATLPSGRLIADRATITESDVGFAPGEAALNFGEDRQAEGIVARNESPSGNLISQPAKWSFGSAFRHFLGRDEATTSRPLQGSFLQEATARPGEETYDWGIFDGWKAEVRGVAIRRGGSGVIDANGRIGSLRTNHTGTQILLRACTTGGQEGVLVAWVADNSRKAATIAADPDNAAYRSGAPCRVSLEPTEPVASSLFSYVRAGALEQARSGVPVLTEMLTRQGVQEKLGADAASMAGYVLQRFRGPGAAQIVDDLADKYPDLADLHVIQGALRISEGNAETAARHFNAALDRGVPCYTEGVRLMRDGLNFLTDLYPADTRIRTNAQRANSLAAAANFNSELTCLRLGPDFSAEFSL